MKVTRDPITVRSGFGPYIDLLEHIEDQSASLSVERKLAFFSVKNAVLYIASGQPDYEREAIDTIRSYIKALGKSNTSISYFTEDPIGSVKYIVSRWSMSQGIKDKIEPFLIPVNQTCTFTGENVYTCDHCGMNIYPDFLPREPLRKTSTTDLFYERIIPVMYKLGGEAAVVTWLETLGFDSINIAQDVVTLQHNIKGNIIYSTKIPVRFNVGSGFVLDRGWIREGTFKKTEATGTVLKRGFVTSLTDDIIHTNEESI